MMFFSSGIWKIWNRKILRPIHFIGRKRKHNLVGSRTVDKCKFDGFSNFVMEHKFIVAYRT